MAKRKKQSSTPSLWRQIKIIETKEIVWAMRRTDGYYYLPDGRKFHISKIKNYQSMTQTTKNAIQIIGLCVIAVLGCLADSLPIMLLIVFLFFIIHILTQ